MENTEEAEPISQEVHFLKNKNVIEIVDKKWPDCLGLLEKATLPKPSENPSEMEAWENGHRLERIKTLSETLNFGETGTLMAMQRLLWEECFGTDAHPELPRSWWVHYSGAPTPGGELSHSYPLFKIRGIGVEDCLKFGFTGETAAEIVNSVTDFTQKDAIASIISKIAFPLSEHTSRSVSERLTRKGKFVPDIEYALNNISARLLIFSKAESLGEDVSDPKVLEIMGQSPDRKISKMLAWRLLWEKFSLALVNPDQSYKKPDSPAVQEAIGQLLRVRLSPDFQGLFKHYSLSAYKVENPS